MDDETIFNLDCGSQGIKESNIIILTLDVGKFTYEIEENSKDTFASSLIYERDITYQYPIFEFECNKKTGDFKLFNPGFTKGNIDKQGDSFLITITKSGDHSNNADCAIYYILDQNDKMPDAPKEYKSISDIKQSTIEEFLENIYEVFGDAM